MKKKRKRRGEKKRKEKKYSEMTAMHPSASEKKEDRWMEAGSAGPHYTTSGKPEEKLPSGLGRSGEWNSLVEDTKYKEYVG